MAYRSLIVPALACIALPAFAGYAQLAPPPGWFPGTGATATYNAAANEAWVAATVRTEASLAVGGTRVVMPAAMRLSANAPVFLAERIGLGMSALGGPIAIGLTVASLLALPAVQDWISGTQSYRWNSELNRWEKKVPGAAGEYFAVLFDQYIRGNPVPVKSMACAAAADAANTWGNGNGYQTVTLSWVEGLEVCDAYGTKYAGFGGQTVHIGTFSITNVPAPADAFQWGPADYQTEVKPSLQTRPLTVAMLNNIKGINWTGMGGDPSSDGWPVSDPVLNPSPALAPQPLTVPLGEPVPVPSTEPTQYKRPGVKIVPAQKPGSPWQVDVQPVDQVSTDPAVDPSSPGTTTSPSDKPPDLCADHPDILACADLDTPDGPDLQHKDAPVSIAPASGFDGGGSCPAPRHFVSQGITGIEISFQPYCDFASGVRPIIVAFSWLAAATMLAMGLKS